MDTSVVKRSDANVVLHNARMEGLLPVRLEVWAADREGGHALDFGLVRKGVADNLLGEQELHCVLAGLNLFQMCVGVHSVKHVLLLVAVRAEGEVYNGAL